MQIPNHPEQNCIFCKIIAHKLSDHIVYEDSDFMAILDIHPRSPGHTLIIPKKHYRWVWDVPNIGAYFEVANKIAQAQRKVFKQDAIWSNVRGDEVPHAHIWVYPHEDTIGDKNDLDGNRDKLIEALSNVANK